MGSKLVSQMAQQLAESPEFQRFVGRLNQSAVRQMRKFTDRGVYKPAEGETPAEAAQRAAEHARREEANYAASSASQQAKKPPQPPKGDVESPASYFPDEYSPLQRWYLTKKYEYMVWKNERKKK